MARLHQKLPPSGPDREALREKGQFWTPQWVARAMVSYALGHGSGHLFDPAVGGGAFFVAAKSLFGTGVRLLGTELHSDALEEAVRGGLLAEDLAGVEIRDFVLTSSQSQHSAIVANPPYIRHHRLSDRTKQALKGLAKQITGDVLDGRTGYHVFFFLKALATLRKGGRLAFIMPADTCEGLSARKLWKWVSQNYRLDAVITFSHQATPFPQVDTNAIVFMISAAEPAERFSWARCLQPDGAALLSWINAGCAPVNNCAINSVSRDLSEALSTGLSRPHAEPHNGPVLGLYIHTLRGIASGANEFFFMTRERAASLDIPLKYYVRAIGRTRDVEGCEFSEEMLEKLESWGRPTFLLSLDGSSIGTFPQSLQDYLQQGIDGQVNERALIRTRRPWYKMEQRESPPYLFAYLGRRNARFIRNRANVVPLTGFLCVYPNLEDERYQEQVWRLLNHPDTILNLSRVAKSYGSGAIKVEPRALERVPISENALRDAGLDQQTAIEQFELAL